MERVFYSWLAVDREHHCTSCAFLALSTSTLVAVEQALVQWGRIETIVVLSSSAFGITESAGSCWCTFCGSFLGEPNVAFWEILWRDSQHPLDPSQTEKVDFLCNHAMKVLLTCCGPCWHVSLPFHLRFSSFLLLPRTSSVFSVNMQRLQIRLMCWQY